MIERKDFEEEWLYDENEQPIESCCKHGIPFDDIHRDSGLMNGCDSCYDEYSDSFSIVRAMEKI